MSIYPRQGLLPIPKDHVQMFEMQGGRADRAGISMILTQDHGGFIYFGEGNLGTIGIKPWVQRDAVM